MIAASRSDYTRWMPWTIAATIVVGLVIDQYAGAWGQSVVNAWVWLLFAVLFALGDSAMRPSLLICLALATVGEIFCSLVWGIYDYRLNNIPLFVPPGHVLLFWLGLQMSRFVDDRWMHSALSVVAGIIVMFTVSGDDWLSAPLFAIFLVCWRFGPSPKLYATMFILALLMEILGTSLGNWTWRSEVPGLAWPTMNPPLAAGACYCVLDVLVQLCAKGRAFVRV